MGKTYEKSCLAIACFLEGSGGHRTMFQNIQVLVDNGYQCDVYVEDHGQVRNSRELKKLVEKYFGEYECNLYLGFQHISTDYDAIFATAWFTAKIVRDIPTAAKKYILFRILKHYLIRWETDI